MSKSVQARALSQPEAVTQKEPVSPVASALRGYALVAAAAFLWSFSGFFIKHLTRTHHVAPETVACLRSAIGGLALAWALPGVAKAPRWRVAWAAAAYTTVAGTFVMATVGTTAANAIILQYAYPLLVAVGAVLLFREPLGRRTILALILGMSGVAVILICSWTPGQREGLAYGVTSAVGFAALTLLQSSFKEGSPVGLASLYNLTAAALLFAFAYGRLHLSATALLITGLMGIFQLTIPYALFIKGLKIIPSTDAALITLLEPVLNPIWVWLLIGETPHPSTVVGGALILSALTVRFLGIRGSERSSNRDRLV